MLRRSRKRKVEEMKQKTNDGEQDNFFSDKIQEEMETMWEIPQIFHFLHLTRESLNVPPLSVYEMERMLSMPRASKQLANIMTCLLSSPITKAKLRKVPPMPYEFWTNILAHKMASWFKVYHAKHKDATKVLETIGVEPEFWNIFPDVSLVDGKDFEDLIFKQRVWLLKTVCDTIMHTRKTVQEDIATQPLEDQFETVLGVDRYGARYIYFPQFVPHDLRIYRHCLDNKILSTVKPVKPKQETTTIKLIDARLNRYRKKKSQSRNNLSDRRSTRHSSRLDDKDLNSDKCNDSGTCSFISEDTNWSSTSTCSNTNNANLDTVDRKRCRSLSKMSEESTLSNARSSSGYDTNTSGDNKSICESPSRMFKGFADVQNDNCKIGIINEILDDLKSEIDEERKSNNNGESTQEDFVESYKNASPCSEVPAAGRNENERVGDNLSNRSKTDDEKLNEIISAESSKLPDDIYLKSVTSSDNASDSSTLTSKSDDEKLSETITSDNNISVNKDNLDRRVTSKLCATFGDSVASHECLSEAFPTTEAESKDSTPEKNLKKRTKLRSRYRVAQRNDESKTEAVDDKTSEADDRNSLASETQEDVEDHSEDDYAINSDYNLRRAKDPKTEEHKRYFNKILFDLNVSDFRLVADSVEGLRDLIGSFTMKCSRYKNANVMETIPQCEAKLIEKMTELLNFLEPIETTLKDARRKAKAKLQREWTNFKEGSVEDQDSSGEGGLSSNWWVLGSQGRDPLSTAGDATLQALPQPALSPLGAQNAQQQAQSAKSEHEGADKNCPEQSRLENRETSADEQQEDRNGEKQPGVKAPPKGRNQVKEKRDRREREENSSDEDTGQQTRRVLRARGVSSYTEHLYSDYETDEDELEEWTDVEAVYAAPGAQADTSAAHAAPKDRHADDRSEEEDSDQDWILPSSRKRKNKRPSANRRLKSFQHKLQNITENTSQNHVASAVSYPNSAKIVKDKSKGKLKDTGNVQTAAHNTVVAPATSNPRGVVPSANAICKIESVSSVHSELNIKDEGPIYESNSAGYEQNSYNPANPQQNYYYVIPQDPGIAGGGIIQGTAALMPQAVQGIAPSIQQGYYVQTGVQSNYVIQNANFVPVQQQQPPPPVYQQQAGPQMIAPQPYVGYAGYVMPHGNPRCAQQNPVNLRPQNRYNRPIAPRQNLPYPNGAVIRSNSAPVRGRQRLVNSQSARGNVSQPRMPNSRAVTRQRATPQKSSTESSGQKTTSLIMLSDDSDDEIEIILPHPNATDNAQIDTPANKAKPVLQAIVDQPKQKPTITSDITVAKSVISPQILQRMNQGGISITPVKNIPPPPAASTNTQLVVVVNETGSHYALALPNGSKLILTPEQVAQIRASNGGKLIL